ncbi:hypothetical protein [Microcoleus sp. S13_C3]|uniref:hypothetical protein n=1 Tax=Microcoleus sp. S13_C3 TaxID=3055409 RepID=UPI002FD60958
MFFVSNRTCGGARKHLDFAIVSVRSWTREIGCFSSQTRTGAVARKHLFCAIATHSEQ